MISRTCQHKPSSFPNNLQVLVYSGQLVSWSVLLCPWADNGLPFLPRSFSRVRFPHSSLSLSLIPSFRVFLPPSPPPRLTLRGSLSLSCDISLSFSRSFAHSHPPPPFIFFLFWVLSRSLAFFLVHSLSPGSDSSFLSHSYLLGLTVSLARSRTLSLSGLPFLWVRFPHSVTQSFFTQSSLLNLSILISQVSLSLSLPESLTLARSISNYLTSLSDSLVTRSCSCSR